MNLLVIKLKNIKQFWGRILMKNYLKKINKNKYLFWGCITMIIFIIWYLTSKTPIYADDYNYKFIWGTNIRVESISDVLISQYNHYFQWGEEA